MPSEVPSPIRFEEDTVHASYDAEAANRFWRILVQVERVLTDTRCTFIGKASPVHFFWGGMDMAVTRFSGRPAPPREGPAFMREAYSQEVISHGFWPGSAPMLEPSFYAYAVPEPAGLKEARVEPAAAYYHKEMGEFILPYEAVRLAADPDAAIRSFVNSTYEQAAALGIGIVRHWNASSPSRAELTLLPLILEPPDPCLPDLVIRRHLEQCRRRIAARIRCNLYRQIAVARILAVRQHQHLQIR